MTEAFFWALIRKRMPPGWFTRRIEDASGNLGTYDCYLAHRDVGQGWLELKVAGPNAKPELRKGQQAFGLNLHSAGVPCGYLIGSPSGKVRLVGPLTNGDDWRDHLVAEWGHLQVADILTTLFRPPHGAELRRAG